MHQSFSSSAFRRFVGLCCFALCLSAKAKAAWVIEMEEELVDRSSSKPVVKAARLKKIYTQKNSVTADLLKIDFKEPFCELTWSDLSRIPLETLAQASLTGPKLKIQPSPPYYAERFLGAARVAGVGVLLQPAAGTSFDAGLQKIECLYPSSSIPVGLQIAFPTEALQAALGSFGAQRVDGIWQQAGVPAHFEGDPERAALELARVKKESEILFQQAVEKQALELEHSPAGKATDFSGSNELFNRLQSQVLDELLKKPHQALVEYFDDLSSRIKAARRKATLEAAALWEELNPNGPTFKANRASSGKNVSAGGFSFEIPTQEPDYMVSEIRGWLEFFQSVNPVLYKGKARNFKDGTPMTGYELTRRAFQRSAPYTETARALNRFFGVPEDLIWLLQQESGWVEDAVSTAKAVGLGQFMPETAKEYGLIRYLGRTVISMRVPVADRRGRPRRDENHQIIYRTVQVEQPKYDDLRKDPFESMRASAEYLTCLARLFDGDFLLAMSSYNGGAGTMKAAIKKAAARNLKADFFTLSKHFLIRSIYSSGKLLTETMEYIPAILGTVEIARRPDRYGHQVPPSAPMNDAFREKFEELQASVRGPRCK